jgi:hypothetical protein
MRARRAHFPGEPVVYGGAPIVVFMWNASVAEQ